LRAGASGQGSSCQGEEGTAVANKRKNGNGEGSVYPRRNKYGKITSWRGSYVGFDGQRRYVSDSKTKTEAKEKVRRALAKADSGLAFDADKITVGDYLKRWLNDTVKNSVKPITYESYQRQVRVHISPALGHVKLGKLTPTHVQGLYSQKLDAGMAPSSVRYIHAVLHRALGQANKWRLVPDNVAAATTPPKPQPKEMNPLDNEEVKRLLEAAHGERLEALFVVAVTAGLRIGELLGLRWEDIDLERGTMRVARTLSRAKSGPRFTTPKNGKGRAIALTRQAVEALWSHRKRQNEERLKVGTLWEDQGLVFPSTMGKPLSRDSVDRRSFKPLLERAGLPKITLHDLRHTCATLLLSKGVHPKYVQELLGHSSIAMTLDRYSHWIPSMGTQTARAMEEALA
jgi:integrase